MRRAAAFIDENPPAAAIARKWGWADAAHFAAAYRQHYGHPPGQTLRT